MTKHTSPAPSILAGIATPSSTKEYTATPTTGSTLRIERYASIDDQQITGGDEMTDEGRGIAQWLSACLSVPPLSNWCAEFREFAREQPDEAKAIAIALSEYVLRDPEGPR